mgnify:CR=1 FL=1
MPDVAQISQVVHVVMPGAVPDIKADVMVGLEFGIEIGSHPPETQLSLIFAGQIDDEIEGVDDILPTMDIEAVEVYHGVSLPVRFGSNSCGAIIVWTRRGERVEGGGSFWRRLALAAGFALLAWLATG